MKAFLKMDPDKKMTVSQGKVHTYLGMTLDYRVRGQVKISMIGYVDKILAAFDKANPESGGTKTSAAPENLFQINEDCKSLNQTGVYSFTILLSNHYLPLNVLGRIPAHQLHSS